MSFIENKTYKSFVRLISLNNNPDRVSGYKKDIFIMLILSVSALLLRHLYLADYSASNIYPLLRYSDSYYYYIWAKDIAHGSIMPARAFMKWPLYAYLSALIFRIFGDNVGIVYFMQFLMGTFNCSLVYLTARLIAGRKQAILTGIFYLLYSPFIFYEGLFTYASLSVFLCSLLFLYLIYMETNNGRKQLLLFGILVGISTITQAGIGIFGSCAATVLIIKKKQNIRKTISDIAVFSAGLAAVVGSITAVNYIAEKDIVLLTGNTGIVFFLGNNPGATGVFNTPANISQNQKDMFRDARIIAENALGRRLKTSEVSGYWFGRSIEYIADQPISWIKLYIKKVLYVFSPNEFIHDIEYYYLKDKAMILKILFADLRLIIPLALMGFILGLRELKRTWLLYVNVICIAFSTTLFYVSTRYRMTMVPALMIFAAITVSSLIDNILKKRNKQARRLGITTLILLFVFNYAFFFPNAVRNINAHGTESGEDCLTRALEYERIGNYDDALNNFEKAIELLPDKQYAVFRMGVLYFSLNDLDAAITCFSNVIRLNPLHVDSYFNLGLILNKKQRFSEAVPMLKKAIKLDPENIDAHYELAMAYKISGNNKDAETEFLLTLDLLSIWRESDRTLIQQQLDDLDTTRNLQAD